VYKGKVPGVYNDLEECRRQVHRFSGNSYKGCNTLVEAETRYANYLARERTREMERSRMTTFLMMMLTAATVFLFYVFLV
jgi:viroplasmin and RNaseH domain-containing protein